MAVAGNIVVRLTGDITGLQASLARATKSVQTAGKAVKRDAAKIGRSLRTIGIAAGVVGGAAVKMAANFDTGVREIGTLLGGLTENEIAGMKSELQDLAVTSGQSIDTLVGAQYDIISTGFASAADSAKILAVSAEAAVGAVSDVNTVAGVVTQALKAYHLEASDARKVTDVLVTTVQQGRTTMDQLGSSLGTVLATANTAKLSLEGLGAAIATATPVIGSSEETTTALNNALFSLEAPAQQAKDAMQAFGIEVKRLDDGSLDLVGTMQQFQGMDLAAIREIIPEKRAARIIQVLANDTKTLQNNLDAMNTSGGKTRQFFEQIAAGAGFKLSQLWEQMKNQLRDLGTELLPSVVEAAKNIGKALKRNSGAIENFIRQVGTIVGWVVKHGDIIGKILVVATIGAAAVKMATLATNVMSLVSSLWELIITPIGLVTAAVIGLAAAFIWLDQNMMAVAQRMSNTLLPVVKALAFVTTDAVKSARLQGLIAGLEAINIQVKDMGMKKPFKSFRESLRGFMDDLNLFQKPANEAKNAIKTTGDTAEKAGNQVEMAGNQAEKAGRQIQKISLQSLPEVQTSINSVTLSPIEKQTAALMESFKNVSLNINRALASAFINAASQGRSAAEAVHDAWHAAIRAIAAEIAARAATFALLSVIVPGGASAFTQGKGALEFIFGSFQHGGQVGENNMRQIRVSAGEAYIPRAIAGQFSPEAINAFAQTGSLNGLLFDPRQSVDVNAAISARAGVIQGRGGVDNITMPAEFGDAIVAKRVVDQYGQQAMNNFARTGDIYQLLAGQFTDSGVSQFAGIIKDTIGYDLNIPDSAQRYFAGVAASRGGGRGTQVNPGLFGTDDLQRMITAPTDYDSMNIRQLLEPALSRAFFSRAIASSGDSAFPAFRSGGMVARRAPSTGGSHSLAPTIRLRQQPTQGEQIINNTFEIRAIDAQSFERYLKRNPDALSQGTKNASRLGYRLE